MMVIRQDGQISEMRLAALYYDLLGHAAAITACANAIEPFREHFESLLLPMVASGRPRWYDRTPASLAELYSLSLSPPSD